MPFAKHMDELRNHVDQRRNKNFAETHRQLIEQAVSLIGRHGLDTLSVASLARAAGMNRSTVYYHFDSREALIEAVRGWVGDRLASLLTGHGDATERLERTVAFGLAHEAVLDMWFADLTEPGDIRARFPLWDILVGSIRSGRGIGAGVGIGSGAGAVARDDSAAEVWGCVMLAAALMGPRLYKSSVRPDDDAGVIARRFARAYQAMLEAQASR